MNCGSGRISFSALIGESNLFIIHRKTLSIRFHMTLLTKEIDDAVNNDENHDRHNRP
jgi:hypothetical protein